MLCTLADTVMVKVCQHTTPHSDSKIFTITKSYMIILMHRILGHSSKIILLQKKNDHYKEFLENFIPPKKN